MKKKSIVIFATAAAFLAACGESTTENITQQITQTGMDVVESVKDLPKCENDNEGEIAWVKGENSSRVCVDGKWFATKDTLVVAGGKDTVVIAGDTVYMDGGDISCTTKELADGSGLKIICNGDSIGVVLNGVAGKDGAPGEQGLQGDKGDAGVGCSIAAQSDTTVTIKCGDKSMTMNIGAGGFSVDTLTLDSEKVATPIASLEGYTQKGPFLKGSTVYLYELSDGRTLRQTNGNFMSYITSDDGRYRFNARNLVSQYAMVVVDGNYRNEVTGKKSERPIRLRAITDVTARSSANVNLLTNLEYERVYYLVTQKKMKVRNAKKQAQAEIFKAFHIDTTGFSKSSEDLDVFGTSDADGALLTISIILQGDRDETDLSVLLTEIANDMETDGKWDGPGSDTLRAKVADWAVYADGQGRFRDFRENVSNWRLSANEPPAFEKFIRDFVSEEFEFGKCGDGISVGTVKYIDNPRSQYYAADYEDATRSNVRFICADADSALWRLATDIEKDTVGWGAGEYDGEVRSGRINKDYRYLYVADYGVWHRVSAMNGLLYSPSIYIDTNDGGTSTITWTPQNLKLEEALAGSRTFEINMGSGYEYPYAGIQFAFSAPENISSWGGVCLTYLSTIGFAIELYTDNEATLTEYNNYRATVGKSTAMQKADFSWAKFKQEPAWGKTVEQATVLGQVAGIRLKVSGIAGTAGEFTILDMGPMGTCSEP